MNDDLTSGPRRLAILGGTFDPPHLGHLLLAQDVVEQAAVDQVWFVPAAQNPHKAQAPMIAGEHRLGMLRAAVEGDDRFAVLDLELRRPGPSYSIDTVKHLRTRFPEATLAWIIGADQLPALASWHAIEALVQEVTFLVLARPGVAVAAPAIPGLRWRSASNRLIEVSATEIRRRLADRKPVDFFLPAGVVNYIEQHRLYQIL